MADGMKFVLLFFLYFTQGLPYGIQTKLIPVLLRSNAVSLTKVSFSRLLSFPWIFKVFIASLLNRFSTIWHWLTLSFCGMALCCGFPGLLGTNVTFVLLSGVFGLNIMAAGQDIAVDTLTIRILDSSDLGLGNIAQVVGYKTGALIGGGLLVWISKYTNWDTVFLILTIFYLVCAVYAYNMHCASLQESNILKRQISVCNNETQVNETSNYSDETIEVTFENNDDGSTNKTIKYADKKHNKTKAHTGTEIKANETKQDIDIKQTIGIKNTEKKQSNTSTGLFTSIFKSKGFSWIVLYVFIYKLGEQGMASMVPLYMLDSGFTVSDVGLITGIGTQCFSILGSVVGGWMASKWGCSNDNLVQLLKWISMQD